MVNGEKQFSVTTIFWDNGKTESRFTRDTDVEGDYDTFTLNIDRFNTKKEAMEFMDDSEF